MNIVPTHQPTAENAETWAQLLSPAGRALLDKLTTETSYHREDPLQLATQLRRDGVDSTLATAVLTQLKLREKAHAKFGEFAQHMFFTTDGLQQATRLGVAAHHARRFQAHGIQHVIDLGCGIGGDAMAFAAIDLQVTAVEVDDITAAVATLNLTPFPHAEVIAAEVETWVADHAEQLSGAGLWLDPARREVSTAESAHRIFDPESFSPPLSFVERLADARHAVGVKLGPGLAHDSIPTTAEAQWVSDHGSVVEVALWFNDLARPRVRRAALVTTAHGSAEFTSDREFGEDPKVEVRPTPSVGGYLYEPDGAVIRSGLIRELMAREFGATAQDSPSWLLDQHIAYFCSDHLVDSDFATAYRVVEVLPYQLKKLKAWIAEHGISRLDIKKRGVDVTPEQLRRMLMAGTAKTRKNTKAGGHQATFVLTRIGDSRVALVVEPVEQS
ncbi:class I SAM-dependent methyltransferase [Auritidibacter ignavus]|uniref:class I SAM-dependent methyltransferase n=1 Tax=Auritidibacter ignavus TaxID=678932 RepID=UPI0024BA9CFF|nr:class I SAM-dependent methyltransferase [Auritidibacter ignavus]WHS28478.1 class I SAM-dependent methyltransferase [Auritidibacter ignavus]